MKFPKCEEYGLFSHYQVYSTKQDWKKNTVIKTSKVELALSKAEKQGAEKVYSCGNCLKLEKELLTKEAGYCRIIQQLSDRIKQLGLFCPHCKAKEETYALIKNGVDYGAVIAKKRNVSQPAVNGILKRMEAEGLIRVKTLNKNPLRYEVV